MGKTGIIIAFTVSYDATKFILHYKCTVILWAIAQVYESHVDSMDSREIELGMEYHGVHLFNHIITTTNV